MFRPYFVFCFINQLGIGISGSITNLMHYYLK